MSISHSGLAYATGTLQGYLNVYTTASKGGTYSLRNNQNFRPSSSAVSSIKLSDDLNFVFAVISGTLYVYKYNSDTPAY